MSDDEDVKKEVKEDHINIKVRDMVRVARTARGRRGDARTATTMVFKRHRVDVEGTTREARARGERGERGLTIGRAARRWAG